MLTPSNESRRLHPSASLLYRLDKQEAQDMITSGLLFVLRPT